jgi:hypothetical protein
VTDLGLTEGTVDERALRHWKLLRAFRQALQRHTKGRPPHRSWRDARRRTTQADYLSLFLLGLFNPVLRTMRGLCAASELPRVQREVCGGQFSLGSFSEAQSLTDPVLLEQVFAGLVNPERGAAPTEGPAAWARWFARDSSLFAALPRMSWALYGGGRAGASNNAVRLHLSLHLLDDQPGRAQVTPGKVCERKAWRETWEAGAAYVGDRYFAENYRLLGDLSAAGGRYVLRLQDGAVLLVEEELPLTAADGAAGVVRQVWGRLGKQARQRSERVRVVEIRMANGDLLRLVTNVPPADLSAAEVGLLYRRRWQIECFFRWLKCLLGCRHWLAESAAGVTLQLYLALIAAVLFQLHTGRRPNRRMLELFQLHQLGWASGKDLVAGLRREAEREARRRAKKS